MTPFTDEDLARMKEIVEHPHHDDVIGDVYTMMRLFPALINRLEAAEKVIGLIEDCTVECDQAIKDWYATRKGNRSCSKSSKI